MKAEDYIEEDFSNYSQDNTPPESFTINEKSNSDWRHYEIGECFGLVAYNKQYHYGMKLKDHVMVTVISEDDGYYFLSERDLTCDAHWCELRGKIYDRMNKWLLENCTRGYYSGFDGVEGQECGFKNLKIHG